MNVPCPLLNFDFPSLRVPYAHCGMLCGFAGGYGGEGDFFVEAMGFVEGFEDRGDLDALGGRDRRGATGAEGVGEVENFFGIGLFQSGGREKRRCRTGRD